MGVTCNRCAPGYIFKLSSDLCFPISGVFRPSGCTDRCTNGYCNGQNRCICDPGFYGDYCEFALQSPPMPFFYTLINSESLLWSGVLFIFMVLGYIIVVLKRIRTRKQSSRDESSHLSRELEFQEEVESFQRDWHWDDDDKHVYDRRTHTPPRSPSGPNTKHHHSSNFSGASSSSSLSLFGWVFSSLSGRSGNGVTKKDTDDDDKYGSSSSASSSSSSSSSFSLLSALFSPFSFLHRKPQSSSSSLPMPSTSSTSSSTSSSTPSRVASSSVASDTSPPKILKLQDQPPSLLDEDVDSDIWGFEDTTPLNRQNKPNKGKSSILSVPFSALTKKNNKGGQVEISMTTFSSESSAAPSKSSEDYFSLLGVDKHS
eukprot:GILI01012763.1.p1 GENE.GILI01012763.1~~GILI01012763.1.p1  ORF type:complete len:371 (+),score=50.36 GILI01012763.1:188-1300(+)